MRMNNAHREKLRHWLTSMLALHLVAILIAGQVWFGHLRHGLYLNPDIDHVLTIFWGPAESYIFLFIPIAVWHAFDFVGADVATSGWRKLLTSYGPFVLCLSLYGVAALFHQTDWLNDLGCPELPPFQFDGCGSWTPWWKTVLAMVPFLAMCGLAMGKMALTVFGWLKAIVP